MKLKAQAVYDSTLVLAQIINEKRPAPQRGKYLLARLHAKLSPEFSVINARREDMIKAYDTPQTTTTTDPVTGDVTLTPIEGQWKVPADKLSEFTAAWKAVCDEEIDVDVQPIPLSSLSLPNGSDGAIQASELITLGELVSDA